MATPYVTFCTSTDLMMNLVVVSIMSAQKITRVETNRESSKGLKMMNGVCVKEDFFKWVCSEEHGILNGLKQQRREEIIMITERKA